MTSAGGGKRGGEETTRTEAGFRVECKAVQYWPTPVHLAGRSRLLTANDSHMLYIAPRAPSRLALAWASDSMGRFAGMPYGHLQAHSHSKNAVHSTSRHGCTNQIETSRHDTLTRPRGPMCLFDGRTAGPCSCWWCE